MTETMKALYRFFSGFGMDAWPENNVPSDARPPYITVQRVRPAWRATVPLYARVWYRSNSYEAIDAKIDEIEEAIGEGVSIPTEHGAVYLFKEDNFAQFQDFDGDPTLKCAYLSMALQAPTK